MRTVRTFWTPGAGFLLGSLGVVLSFTVGAQPWTGDAVLIANWTFTALFLVGAPLAAVAGWEAGRHFGHGSERSLFNTSRYRRGAVLRWWATTVALTLAPLAAGWVLASLTVTHYPPQVGFSVAVTWVAGAATVAAVVLVGFLLGRLLGSVAGPVAGFAVVLLILVMGSNNAVRVFYSGGASVSLVGLRIDQTAAALQMFSPLLLVVVGLWAVTWRRDLRVQYVVPLAVLIALAVGHTTTTTNLYAFRDMARSDYSCDTPAPDDPAPPVCVTTERAWLGADLSDEFRALWSIADSAGVEGLDRPLYERVPTEGPPTERALNFSFTNEHLDRSSARRPVTTEDVVTQITQPAWCPALWTDSGPEEAYWNDVDAARDHLLAIVAPGASVDPSVVADFNEAWARVSSCQGAGG